LHSLAAPDAEIQSGGQNDERKVGSRNKVVVIALACVIGYYFWQARRTTQSPLPDSVKAGDQLPGLLAYNWKAHDHTLVLALRNGCHFCEASMPFCRKLADLEKSKQIDAHLIAVLPDEATAVRQLEQTQELAVEALPGVDLSQVKVDGTPTLLLVDRQGRVPKVSIGQLAAAGEADVIAVLSKQVAKM
jgi:hypothetical protein